jgi:exodeoxyribonuclease VII large subunit
VLGALNPSNVLGRGYSYVSIDTGGVMTSLKDYKKVASGTKLEIHFHDGKGSALKD